MSTAHQISAVFASIALAILAWNFVRARCDSAGHDAHWRERRRRIAWEIRLLVVVTAGPLAWGVVFGPVPADYGLPLTLFVVSGLLAADAVAPHGASKER